MNSLYQQLNPNQAGMSLPNNISQIMNMMNMVKNAGNPKAMLNSLISKNPQMKSVMDMVQQSGGDPKAAFYKMAEQKGVDPNTILQMLQ